MRSPGAGNFASDTLWLERSPIAPLRLWQAVVLCIQAGQAALKETL